MSILIPGKMPTECWECPCAYETEGAHHNYCQAAGYDTTLPDEGRPDWCPLIELPPHGRLIDADALNIYQMEENVRADGDPNEYEYDAGLIDGLHIAAKDVSVAPTIIPAEGGADNA